MFSKLHPASCDDPHVLRQPKLTFTNGHHATSRLTYQICNLHLSVRHGIAMFSCLILSELTHYCLCGRIKTVSDLRLLRPRFGHVPLDKGLTGLLVLTKGSWRSPHWKLGSRSPSMEQNPPPTCKRGLRQEEMWAGKSNCRKSGI